MIHHQLPIRPSYSEIHGRVASILKHTAVAMQRRAHGSLRPGREAWPARADKAQSKSVHVLTRRVLQP